MIKGFLPQAWEKNNETLAKKGKNVVFFRSSKCPLEEKVLLFFIPSVGKGEAKKEKKKKNDGLL